MVQAPRHPTAKPVRKPRKTTSDNKATAAAAERPAQTTSTSQARPDDSLHCAKLTVVAPSCSQNVYWAGRGFGWPLESPHACLNCCHGFEGPPVGLPVLYDDRTDGFRLWGNFCSFSCCKRYVLETRRVDTSHLIDNLVLLAIKAHKQDVKLRSAPRRYFGISTAPPRTALKLFGGGLTIEEFRSGSVRVTELLAKEPFVKMTWEDAVVAVKESAARKSKRGAVTDPLAPPKPSFAVGRANPVRRKNTLDAFLRA